MAPAGQHGQQLEYVDVQALADARAATKILQSRRTSTQRKKETDEVVP